jgi:hypothetical protein
MSTRREIKEGMQYQGADETIVYTLTTTPWGSSPGSVSAKIFEVDGDTYTDKTSTNMTGSASATGDIITLPAIHSLVAGTLYRVEVAFTCSGNIFEAFAYINAER